MKREERTGHNRKRTQALNYRSSGFYPRHGFPGHHIGSGPSNTNSRVGCIDLLPFSKPGLNVATERQGDVRT